MCIIICNVLNKTDSIEINVVDNGLVLLKVINVEYSDSEELDIVNLATK